MQSYLLHGERTVNSQYLNDLLRMQIKQVEKKGYRDPKRNSTPRYRQAAQNAIGEGYAP